MSDTNDRCGARFVRHGDHVATHCTMEYGHVGATHSDTTTTDPFDQPATADTVVYVVGHNLRGYLPESAPTVVLTAVSALEVFGDNLRDVADYWSEAPDWDEDARGFRADADTARNDAIAVLARFTDEDLREEAARDHITSGGADADVQYVHHWVERQHLFAVWTPTDDGFCVDNYGTVRTADHHLVTVGEVLDVLNEA